MKLVRFLPLLAIAAALHAEDSDLRKKKETAQSPKPAAVVKPKAVSPLDISSTVISEVVAQNITIQPGTQQQFFAQSDFTGASKAAIGIYTSTDQNLSSTGYLVWWASPSFPFYVSADFIDGKSFHFGNTGGAQVPIYGNQLLIVAQNNGTAPVNITQITVYATAR